jgi:hypothetical protein
MEVTGEFHTLAAFPRERTTVPIKQDAGWAPEPVWTVLEKRNSLALTGIKTPDRPARGSSLSDYAVPAPSNVLLAGNFM